MCAFEGEHDVAAGTHHTYFLDAGRACGDIAFVPKTTGDGKGGHLLVLTHDVAGDAARRPPRPPPRRTPRRTLHKKTTAVNMSSNPSALYTPQDIKGWTALVTGASSGFGKALCGNQPVRRVHRAGSVER